MNIERFDNESELSAALAAHVLEAIAAQPDLVLGLPTGRTPLGLYRELRERSGAADVKNPAFGAQKTPAFRGGHARVTTSASKTDTSG